LHLENVNVCDERRIKILNNSMKKKDIEQLSLLYEFVVGKSTLPFQKNGRTTITTGGGGFRPPPPPETYDGDPGDDDDDEDEDPKRGGRLNDPFTPMPAEMYATPPPRGLYTDRKKYAALGELHKGLGPGHYRAVEEPYEMPIDKFLSLLSIMWGSKFNSEFKVSPKNKKYQEKVTAAIGRVEKLPSFYLARFEPDFDKGIVSRVSYEGDYKR
jgi:hypothetical protein